MWVLLKKPYKVTKTPETTVVKQSSYGFSFFNIRLFGAFGNEEWEDQRLSNHGFFKLP